MCKIKSRKHFVECLLTLFIVLFVSISVYPQITVTQSELMEIFTPGLPFHVIEGENAIRNIGNTGGPNEYDFTYVNMQDMFTMQNYQVSTLPILTARYPSNAHTIGESEQNIVENPVFFSSNDSTYYLGTATIESEYRFTHYEPDELFSTFPITYGSSFGQFIEIWDTTYDLSWQIIQASFYTSQQDMTVDGYGTLKLPGMDLECLRQKRNYPDYGFKEFFYFTREGILVVVSDVPINGPDTGFVFGDYVVLLSSNFVSVESEENIPMGFSLEQNYPNPFNPSTKIKYSIPNAERFAESLINNSERIGNSLYNVTLKVYDVLGDEVATLVNEEKQVGEYEVEFNSHSGEGRNLSSGIYFYKLQAGNFVETKKMILIK